MVGRWESRDQLSIEIGPFRSVHAFGVAGAMLRQMALLARERPSTVVIGRVDVPNEQQNPTLLSVSNTGLVQGIIGAAGFFYLGWRALLDGRRAVMGHQAHPDPHWFDCRRVSMSAHCSPCHRWASGMRCVECSSIRRRTCRAWVMVRHVSFKAWFMKGLRRVSQQGHVSCSS
jgi:hypothetical protein